MRSADDSKFSNPGRATTHREAGTRPTRHTKYCRYGCCASRDCCDSNTGDTCRCDGSSEGRRSETARNEKEGATANSRSSNLCHAPSVLSLALPIDGLRLCK